MISKLSIAGAGLLAGWLASPAFALDGPFNQSFQANALELANVAGRVEIHVGGSGVSVNISGDPEELQAIEVSAGGNTVHISSSRSHHSISGDPADLALYKITVPKGAALSVEGATGEAEIGDIGGPLKLTARSLDGHLGAMNSALLRITGSGDLGLGDVAGRLDLAVMGSGSVTAADCDSADIEIAGSGDVSVRRIRHDLTAKIAGSGDMEIESVNGPVDASLAGSGDLTIGSGRAAPLKVQIVGSGDFDFDGEAVDPDITVYGSGGVRIGSYSGKLQSRGANITIGR